MDAKIYINILKMLKITRINQKEKMFSLQPATDSWKKL